MGNQVVYFNNQTTDYVAEESLGALLAFKKSKDAFYTKVDKAFTIPEDQRNDEDSFRKDQISKKEANVKEANRIDAQIKRLKEERSEAEEDMKSANEPPKQISAKLYEFDVKIDELKSKKSKIFENYVNEELPKFGKYTNIGKIAQTLKTRYQKKYSSLQSIIKSSSTDDFKKNLEMLEQDLQSKGIPLFKRLINEISSGKNVNYDEVIREEVANVKFVTSKSSSNSNEEVRVPIERGKSESGSGFRNILDDKHKAATEGYDTNEYNNDNHFGEERRTDMSDFENDAFDSDEITLESLNVDVYSALSDMLTDLNEIDEEFGIGTEANVIANMKMSHNQNKCDKLLDSFKKMLSNTYGKMSKKFDDALNSSYANHKDFNKSEIEIRKKQIDYNKNQLERSVSRRIDDLKHTSDPSEFNSKYDELLKYIKKDVAERIEDESEMYDDAIKSILTKVDISTKEKPSRRVATESFKDGLFTSIKDYVGVRTDGNESNLPDIIIGSMLNKLDSINDIKAMEAYSTKFNGFVHQYNDSLTKLQTLYETQSQYSESEFDTQLEVASEGISLLKGYFGYEGKDCTMGDIKNIGDALKTVGNAITDKLQEFDKAFEGKDIPTKNGIEDDRTLKPVNEHKLPEKDFALAISVAQKFANMEKEGKDVPKLSGGSKWNDVVNGIHKGMYSQKDLSMMAGGKVFTYKDDKLALASEAIVLDNGAAVITSDDELNPDGTVKTKTMQEIQAKKNKKQTIAKESFNKVRDIFVNDMNNTKSLYFSNDIAKPEQAIESLITHLNDLNIMADMAKDVINADERKECEDWIIAQNNSIVAAFESIVYSEVSDKPAYESFEDFIGQLADEYVAFEAKINPESAWGIRFRANMTKVNEYRSECLRNIRDKKFAKASKNAAIAKEVINKMDANIGKIDESSYSNITNSKNQSTTAINKFKNSLYKKLDKLRKQIDKIEATIAKKTADVATESFNGDIYETPVDQEYAVLLYQNDRYVSGYEAFKNEVSLESLNAVDDEDEDDIAIEAVERSVEQATEDASFEIAIECFEKDKEFDESIVNELVHDIKSDSDEDTAIESTLYTKYADKITKLTRSNAEALNEFTHVETDEDGYISK